MKPQQPSTPVSNLIKQETGEPDEKPEIISFHTMQFIIGLIAIFLPIVVWAGYAIFGSHQAVPLDSISGYYYTFMRDVFVGALCMVALFLFAYKGYIQQPMIISENAIYNIAGVFCVLIALFSMNIDCCELYCPVPFCSRIGWKHECFFGTIHSMSAGILFVLLGFVSVFLFTKTGNKSLMTPKKKVRNGIYRAMGILIWVSLAVYVICDNVPLIKSHIDTFPLLFCVETVCLEAFGLSWLVKSEAIPFL